jgi:two-component system chemotaxis response regulator CheB
MMTILVVDDTILYRKLISDIAESIPGVRVVGTASNGKIALSRIALLKPDLVTLDVEMPEMNGLEVLEAARSAKINTAFLMVSALTTRGAELSLHAIELGAIDAVAKPDGNTIRREEFTGDLRGRIEAFARKGEIRKILSRQGPVALTGDLTQKPAISTVVPGYMASRQEPRALPVKRIKDGHPCEIISIGISTGGPAALLEMIPSLPASINVPILIVQHMPALFTASLANSLQSRGNLPVKEGENGEIVKAGTVYIAPGGKQMRVDLGADAITKILRITDDPPENHCKPSVDYLFRSVARHYYGRALALVMTGMGDDGARATGDIRKAGGEVLVQDEESSVVWGMPGATVERGNADAIFPLGRLAAEIISRIR